MRTHLSILLAAVGLVMPIMTRAAAPPDSLIKTASSSAVYYLAADGKRYVFPNQRTYASWFTDFSGVVTVSDSEMATYMLGGNVTYRPGIRMVKIQTDPKIYAVAPGGVLRWVSSETLAQELYGQFWNQSVDDLSDAFFLNYVMGEPIDATEDFSPQQSAELATTINADKGIAVSATPRRSDTEVANAVDAWVKFAFDDVNELRRQNGRAPLVMNGRLNRIAHIHSMDMALNIGELAHEGSLGESSDDRIRFGKVPDVDSQAFMTVPAPEDVDWSGENVGWATTSRNRDVYEAIRVLHRGFLDEPDDEHNHRSNMLSTFNPYSEIGIGIYVDDKGGVWLTQDFISH